MQNSASTFVSFLDQISVVTDRIVESLGDGKTSEAVSIASLLALAATLIEQNPQEKPDVIQALLAIIRVVLAELVAAAEPVRTH